MGEGHKSLMDKPSSISCMPTNAAQRSVGPPPGMAGCGAVSTGGWHRQAYPCLLGMLTARVNPWIMGLEVPEVLRGGSAYTCALQECSLNKQQIPPYIWMSVFQVHSVVHLPPTAAVTSDLKLGGLRQRRGMPSQSRRSESEVGLRLKARCSPGSFFLSWAELFLTSRGQAPAFTRSWPLCPPPTDRPTWCGQHTQLWGSTADMRKMSIHPQSRRPSVVMGEMDFSATLPRCACRRDWGL